MTAPVTALVTGSDGTTATVEPRRHIFLVANNLEELGGVQRLAHTLAIAFSDRGHDVTAIGIMHPKLAHDYGDRPYRWLVLNEEPEPKGPEATGTAARLDPRVRRAARVHDAARTDSVRRLSDIFAKVDDGIVIVLQVWSMNWVSAADTDHLRVIGMSHESFDAALNSRRYDGIRSFYPDVDLFLLLTRDDADQFEREGFNNVGVMRNALGFFPPRTADRTAKVVVAAGRYAPEKGYDKLIDAFASLADDHPDWTLRIFGHGPLEGPLREQAARLGLEGRVEIPGLAADMEAELLDASVFALSSVHEGLPMALAEAMACGLACVAFDCAAGVREIVTDGVDGIVVPPRSTEALAGALRAVMDDAELRDRLGSAARQSVRRFSRDAVLDDWARVFAVVDR